MKHIITKKINYHSTCPRHFEQRVGVDRRFGGWRSDLELVVALLNLKVLGKLTKVGRLWRLAVDSLAVKVVLSTAHKVGSDLGLKRALLFVAVVFGRERATKAVISSRHTSYKKKQRFSKREKNNQNKLNQIKN